MGPDLGIRGASQSPLRGLFLDLVLSCPGHLGPGHSRVSAGPRQPVLSWEADESSARCLFSLALSVGEGCCSVEVHCQRP